MGLMGDPATSAGSLPTPGPTLSHPISTSDGSLRAIDTSKVTLKEKKKKDVPITESSATTKEPINLNPSNVAAKGLGFGVALWETQKPSSTQSADLFGTLDIGPTNQKDSLFFDKQGSKPDDDEFKPVSSGKVLGRFKVAAEENDDELGDLKIKSITEKEDSLDFDLFGKSSIVQGGKERANNEKAISKIKKEDLEIEGSDVISQLEAVTVERRPQTIFTSVALPTETDVSESADLDLSALDLNAYISSNSSSSGGLFD